ncbi:hypothetical protein [Roseivirga sp. E12]|uniref:hypothetical protein n=1 Tax=Roseivirga sp. E12 TaxID=2819237 RepID=UPI001ABD10C7|nr:hypothetical protein [Roseivirga sp. E12]MBO3700397.1 hypothetical protein [Roseivirga sp. E12]
MKRKIKIRFMSMLMLCAFGLLLFSPFEAQAFEGDRYKIRFCVDNEGGIGFTCNKVDPNGPCVESQDCVIDPEIE